MAKYRYVINKGLDDKQELMADGCREQEDRYVFVMGDGEIVRMLHKDLVKSIERI